MKLRLYGNSIRLRLSQTEVDQLSRGETLTTRTALFPQPLVCRLRPSQDPTPPVATFNAGVLDVVFDGRQILHWAGSDVVGLNGVVSRDGQEPVRLLIEKDFQCLHGDGENQPDTFPNPLTSADASA